MINFKRFLMTTLIVLTFLTPNILLAYTIDGNVSDWGINLSNATSDGYLNGVEPSSPTADHISEDYVRYDGYVEPGYGGQTFDIEAMYFDNDSIYGYLAIITGLPITGSQGFEPGDLGIDVTGATAAVVDGSTPSTIYEYGIKLSLSDPQLYAVGQWTGSYYDGSPSPDYGQYSDPWIINTTSGAGMYADFAYSGSAINYHYVYEFAFLLADLGLQSGGNVGFHWTMECGNDFLNLNATVNPVPEPATMLLLGIGMIGLGAIGRRKFKK